MSEEAFSWTREAAAHLLRRAGFGGAPAEIDDLFARGLAGAVSRLVDYEAIDTTAYEAALNAHAYGLTTNRGLQQWDLDRMAFSPRPRTVQRRPKPTSFWMSVGTRFLSSQTFSATPVVSSFPTLNGCRT